MLHPIGPQRVAFPGHNGACPRAVTHAWDHNVIWEQTGPSTTTSKAVLGFMLRQVTYKTMPFPLVSKEWHFLVTTVPVHVQSHMLGIAIGYGSRQVQAPPHHKWEQTTGGSILACTRPQQNTIIMRGGIMPWYMKQ